MTKPRTGTLTDRAPGIWRLQVTTDPDPVTGEVRRKSRTVRGNRAQTTEVLQRLVVEAGAGLHLGSRVTVAELLAQFKAAPTQLVAYSQVVACALRVGRRSTRPGRGRWCDAGATKASIVAPMAARDRREDAQPAPPYQRRATSSHVEQVGDPSARSTVRASWPTSSTSASVAVSRTSTSVTR